jgi:chromate transporter
VTGSSADMDDSLARVPSRTDLFLTYGKIGLIGFGGINAWARRVLVEEKRWLNRNMPKRWGLGRCCRGPMR